MDTIRDITFVDLIEEANKINDAFNDVKTNLNTEEDFLNGITYAIERDQSTNNTAHQKLIKKYNEAIRTHLESINEQRNDFKKNHFGKVLGSPSLIYLKSFDAKEYIQKKQRLTEKIDQTKSSIIDLTLNSKENEQQIENIVEDYGKLLENIQELEDQEKSLTLSNNLLGNSMEQITSSAKKQVQLIELKNIRGRNIEELDNKLNNLKQIKEDFDEKISGELDIMDILNPDINIKYNTSSNKLTKQLSTEEIKKIEDDMSENDAKILDIQNEINDEENSIKSINRQLSDIQKALKQSDKDILPTEKKAQEIHESLQQSIKKVNNGLQELGYEVQLKLEENKIVTVETDKATDSPQLMKTFQKLKNLLPFGKTTNNPEKSPYLEYSLENSSKYGNLMEQKQKLETDLGKIEQEKSEAENQLRDLEEIEDNAIKLNEKIDQINDIYSKHKNWQDQTIQYIQQFLQQQQEFDKLGYKISENAEEDELKEIIKIVSAQAITPIIVSEQTTTEQRIFLKALEEYTELSKKIIPILSYTKTIQGYSTTFTEITEKMRGIYSAFFDKEKVSYKEGLLILNNRTFKDRQKGITDEIKNINQKLTDQINEQLEKEKEIISGKFEITTSHSKTKSVMLSDYKNSKRELIASEGEQDLFKKTKELFEINTELKGRRNDRTKENWKMLAKKLQLLKVVLRFIEVIRGKISLDKSLADSNIKESQMSSNAPTNPNTK